ncbi:hypothetical protein C3L33_22353, partial [Rhododendron williamsianum]
MKYEKNSTPEVEELKEGLLTGLYYERVFLVGFKTMLLLFETPAGFAIFKVLDEGKLSKVEDLAKEFSSADSARQVVKLKAFSKFENTSEALSAATLLIDSKPSKGFGSNELGFISQPISYKLKFSPDKVDTMIIQAIGLLDDLDKELNTYAMRVREWYGWHFPELAKIVQDNIVYAKAVKLMGYRSNAAKLDFSEILTEEVEIELKEAVMNTIAPNLTALVGELVGARLIAHGGSLLNLAKQPGSTVQILGAEKALFRALKTKHATPKYGLIYHASLIGQAAPKHKGKISRSLAAKSALAIRYDALGDSQDNSMGLENRVKLEARLRNLEGRDLSRSAGSAKGKPKIEFYDKDRKKGAADSTLGRAESAAEKEEEMEEAGKATPVNGEKKEKKKKKKTTAAAAEEEEEVVAEPESEEVGKKEKKKKKKHAAKEDGENAAEEKKKKKRKHAEAEEEETETPSKKEKKKKKKKSED